MAATDAARTRKEDKMTEDCIFCKIVGGEVPAEKLYEDEQVVAFKDIHPAAPHHLLLVPRRHIVSVNEATEQNEALLGHLFTAAARLARKLGVEEKGYRCVVSTGPDAGQLVFHLHMHFLAGRELGWPPG